MNRPYADLRPWHLGFSVGMHTQDLRFSHNGMEHPNGTVWYMEQPSFSPGFSIGGLADLRLNRWFNLRFNPGLWFGSREIAMRESFTGETKKQNLKSTYVVLPVDVKFSALRYKNSRPYVSTGIMPAFDVTKDRFDYLSFKTADLYLTFALGCDFYLPYFKLIPEIKFCLGLTDILRHSRPDLADDPQSMRFTQSLEHVKSSLITLTFYFE